MSTRHFPRLAQEEIGPTRDALHGYARVLGDWLKACRAKRKHWWHASLRPGLNGVTTGIVRGQEDFEVLLDFRESLARVTTATGDEWLYELAGQSPAEFSTSLRVYLETAGVAPEKLPPGRHSKERTPGYSRDAAQRMGRALAAVSSALEKLRADIREECSPIQVWPHHFDLSMLWLPGERVDGEDPADEEQSDKQLNFGFVFGDDSVPEPYFYVTAYPFPEAMTKLSLPDGAQWQTDSFKGAVVTWQCVAKKDDPTAYLLELWSTLLEGGRKHLLTEGQRG